MSRRSAAALAAALLAPAAPAGLEGPAEEQPVEYERPERVGGISSDRLKEVSGIVPVTGKPGCFWVHNDSGDRPRIFAVHETGRILARVDVRGAKSTDWEDIADGPAPGDSRVHLYIGDIGNNKLARQELSVYRIRQPEIEPPPEGREPQDLESEPAARIRFRYPDKPFDCEALVVHPLTARIYLLTKTLGRARVFSCEGSAREKPHVLVEEAAFAPRFLVTAADLSADGRRLLLRTYLGVEERRLPPDRPFVEIFAAPRKDLPGALWEIQGEAICYDHEDRDYLSVNEGKPLLIHRARRIAPRAKEPPGEGRAPAPPPAPVR